MTESDRLDDARKTSEAIRNRDRRRIRALAFVTISMWLLAALFVMSFYLPFAAHMKQEMKALIPELNGGVPPTTEQITHAILVLAKHGFVASSLMLGVVMLAEMVAAVLTVTLVFSVRRMTLRHVSDQLAEISRQLDELRKRA